jgi:hypothetical protein
MGIVKISDLLHDDIRDASKAMSRSVNAQAVLDPSGYDERTLSRT